MIAPEKIRPPGNPGAAIARAGGAAGGLQLVLRRPFDIDGKAAAESVSGSTARWRHRC